MLNRRVLTSIPLITWLMVSGAWNAYSRDPKLWQAGVEAGLQNGEQRAVLATRGEASAILVSTVQLGPQGNALDDTLSTSVLAPATTFTLTLPRVDRDTYFEVTATTCPARLTTAPLEGEAEDAADSEPEPESVRLLTWRTVARPPGKRLIDYPGRDDMPPPPDFDQYWERAKMQLGAVPVDAHVTRVPDHDTSTGLLYRVDLASVQNARIVCWLFVPREAYDESGEKVVKKFPAILIAPGYGAEQAPMDRTRDGFITLSINPRNHGPSKEFWKAPVDHLVYNLADPENYYYKLAFLDCLRGAQFLFSREEVDPKRVAAEGGSQGGLFALAMAALEPRIACVASNVTAFSAYPDGMALATVGHHTQFRRLLADADTTTAERMRLSLAYTDGANMATRVRCPVQINMGGLDPVCPYVCGVVIHNRLPKGVAREIHVFPDALHQVPPAMRENNRRWYDRWLKP